jgi:N6-adenosine-specific RNA methylase IME4
MTDYLDLPAITAEWMENRPFGGFPILFADPAWNFSSNSKEKPGKNARRHYDTMSIAQMCAMPVKALAAKDALLCLWVTSPFAEQAFKVVKAWGFQYKTQLTWPKNTVATGYWARGQHELLYVCRRGLFPCERPALFPTSIIPGKTRGHSVKPDWPQQIVEARFPDLPKTELFARQQRPGWTASGNETTKLNPNEGSN